MKKIDIAIEDLKTVLQILAEHAAQYPVWAFGSRVTGNARKFSDLDLAIMSEKPLDFNTYADLKEAFSESNLPFKVDVIDWSSITDEFKKIIQSQYVILKK